MVCQANLCTSNSPAASAAEVTSDNVVGYTKIALPANKMTIIGNQFQNVGKTTINIQDITVGGNFAQTGIDWIKFWDADTMTYQQAFYFGEDADGVFDPEDYDYENSLGAGWGDRDQIIVDIDIDVGQGFWVQSVKGGTVIFPTVK